MAVSVRSKSIRTQLTLVFPLVRVLRLVLAVLERAAVVFRQPVLVGLQPHARRSESMLVLEWSERKQTN